MSVLCVIPARKGSKRIPNKNIVNLGGKPLIMWSIETAKACPLFNQVVVTSDDPSILRLADANEVVAHHRQDYLARDDTGMLPVVNDVVAHFPADLVCLLQPTSPFRTPEDIEGSLALLKKTNADSVFSTTKAPDELVFQVGWAQRLHTLPNIVFPNGSIFWITNEALEKGLSWFDGECYGYPMPKERSIDIDTPLDLELAKLIARAA